VRVLIRSLVVASGLAALATAIPAPAHAEGGDVGVLVLKEHGVGSAAQAQPYLDKFVAVAAKQNGWAGAKGSFQTTRNGADAFVQAEKPHFGIFSLGAFLGLKSKYNLETLGQVSMSRPGGQEYHLVSKTATDLAGCKGKTLASDHADDAKFIEGVVAGGKWKLGEFTLVATTRPLQTVKKVVSDEAVCALIDDAQLAELSHVEGAAGIKSVWKSDKLPAMVVAAFPAAPAAERTAFKSSLGKLCEGEGKAACAEVGIQALQGASDADVARFIAAYGK
jgi:hypothetical protein